MRFSDLLAELPALSTAERQLLVRHALGLDESPVSPAEEAEVERRQTAHRQNPSDSLSLDDMKARLRSRFSA